MARTAPPARSSTSVWTSSSPSSTSGKQLTKTRTALNFFSRELQAASD